MLNVRYSGFMAMAAVLLGASGVFAQPALQDQIAGIDEEIAVEAEYCGNMGTVKSASIDSIVIDGMNWDFESENETVEETYVIDPSQPPQLDGYALLSDIKSGDFIGIECENRGGKLVATLVQSEAAINKAFEEVAGEIDGEMEGLEDIPDIAVEETQPPAVEAVP